MDEKKTPDVRGGDSQEREGDEAAVAESDPTKQRKILEAFGTIDFDPDYDYKAVRKKKRL